MKVALKIHTDTLTWADGGAEFSTCRRYRYRLWRHIGPGARRVAFLMLNPSTADERRNDPTIKRCIGFANAWGFGWLEVWNVFGFRSTDPKALWDITDPVGPANDISIAIAAPKVELIVCAWGAHPLAVARGPKLRNVLAGRELHALKLTRDGDPGHPLYLSSLLKPFRFEPREAA